MDDIRIQQIINESINDLLLSEGLFGNKELKRIKEIIEYLNDMLLSLNKGISLNKVVFKQTQPTNQQQSQQAQPTTSTTTQINSSINKYGTVINERKYGKKKKGFNPNQRQNKPQPQQQPQQGQQQWQQSLTQQQQYIQSLIPKVERCWNWGKECIRETINLLKQYLSVNGIKENKLYEDASGTMVNPMQILRGAYQTGKNQFFRSYRSGYNFPDKIKGWIEKYSSFERGIKNKEQLTSNIKRNITDYLKFCKAVDDCTQQIQMVANNVVFGEEISQDIYEMTQQDIRNIYTELNNMKFLNKK